MDKKTSQFMSPTIYVHTTKGKINITDSCDEIFIGLSQDDPFQQIYLTMSMNTLKILEYEIGFFKETYTIVLEIFDINREYVKDKMVIDHCKPVSYPNLNITMLNNSLLKDPSSSADKTNLKHQVFKIVLVNKYVEPASKSKAFLWDDEVKYDEVWNTIVSSLQNEPGAKIADKDPISPENRNKKMIHYFQPYDRYYNIIPSVMLDGYIKPNEGVGAFLITEKGYYIHNLHESLKRRTIQTKVYPENRSVEDFEHVFVTDFYLDRNPNLKLQFGTIQYTIGENQWRSGYIKKKWKLIYDKKDRILFKNIFDNIESKATEYYNIPPYEDNFVTTSLYNVLRKMNRLTLIINRWSKFEHFIPLRYRYKIIFSSQILQYYTDYYYVNSYKLTVKREKQEFIPEVKLDLELFSLGKGFSNEYPD